MNRLLVVTAVEAERAAIAGAATDVIVGGVGPAASAAATSAALAGGGFDLVLCAGIGGGFGAVPVGGVAVASAIVFADLGAETPDGFAPASVLGFGQEAYPVDEAFSRRLAATTGARLGTIVTVATVTGTRASAERLVARFPDAVAEGMEGAGVAAAAARYGLPCAEIRAISNPVGPRDRDAWRVPEALAALARAVEQAGWAT